MDPIADAKGIINKHFSCLSPLSRAPLQTGDEHGGSGRLSSSCSTSDTRCVNLDTNPVISHEWGSRTGKCLRQVEHIRGHLWHRYSIAVNQVMAST